MKCRTFFITSKPDHAGVIDQTSVTFNSNGDVLLQQQSGIIILDKKQIKQLISELNKEYK